LRIKGPLNNVITYLGVILLLAPWVAIPFLPQPRYWGAVRMIMNAVGFIAIAGGLLLYAASLRWLLPAFRDRFTEFTPGRLVADGPYARLRHPVYLACLVILFGLCLETGAALSIMFLPFLVLELRLTTLYEERAILGPKFGDQYREYRARVHPAILGWRGGIAATGVYLLLTAAGATYLVKAAAVPFIR
jgi:protein-S-isoprenylcysteine O-methyltransferase Ste14